MKRIIRLNESDIKNIVRSVILETLGSYDPIDDCEFYGLEDVLNNHELHGDENELSRDTEMDPNNPTIDDFEFYDFKRGK